MKCRISIAKWKIVDNICFYKDIFYSWEIMVDKFNAIRSFCRVVECQSFSEAARQLDLSVAMVSKQISGLEQLLSIQLFRRTTRRVHPTDEGMRYYQHVSRLMDELADVEQQLGADTSQLTGQLRVSVPMDFGFLNLIPFLSEFCAQYPELKMDIEFSDRRVAVVDEGFDLVLRIGHLEDSSLIARRLGEITLMTCAASTYLERFGMPAHPRELREYNCLVYSNSGRNWRYLEHGRPLDVLVDGNFRSNNGLSLVEMAAAGHGIIYQPDFLVNRRLDSGELVPLLSRFWPEPVSLYALYPQRMFLPMKVRRFIEFIGSKLGARPAA